MNMWNPSWSKYSRISILFALCFLVYLADIAQTRADTMEPYIQVYGVGEVSAIPDMATITLTISQTELKLNAAQENVEERALGLLQVLKGFKIKEGSLDSSQVVINPKYDYRTNRQSPSFIGYEVTQTISFSLVNLEQLGNLISSVGTAKVDRMQPIRFENSKAKELTDKALSNAIEHSKELAESIADQYGVKLGRVLQVEYLTPDVQGVSTRMLHAEMASGAPSSHQQKDLIFKASVKAVFGFN